MVSYTNKDDEVKIPLKDENGEDISENHFPDEDQDDD